MTVAETTSRPGVATPVQITITNNSDETITDLQADAVKSPLLRWTAGSSGTGWTCSDAGSSDIALACLPALPTLEPGDSTTLAPTVTVPAHAERGWDSKVRVMGDGMAGTIEVDFTITVTAGTGATAASAFGFAPANVF